MDFALTDSQRDLVDTARRYLADRYPADRLRSIAETTGTDTEAWPDLVKLGWLDPQLGRLEHGLLAIESGYALHPTPWLTTVAAGAGDTTATVVSGQWRATRSCGQWRFSGEAVAVPDAAAVETLVLSWQGRSFTVDREFAEVRTGLTIDPLRRACDLTLVEAPATPVHGPGWAPAVTAALLACESVGVAARALDVAVAHAGSRIQFGRPIGAFQAVAHQLADAYLELELARSLALRAAWLTGQGLAVAAAAALSQGRKAAVRCCETAIQTLGAIGFTEDHPLHMWLRRAYWLDNGVRDIAGDTDTILAEAACALNDITEEAR